MQLIVRSLTTHVLDVSPDANVEVAMLVFSEWTHPESSVPDPYVFGPPGPASGSVIRSFWSRIRCQRYGSAEWLFLFFEYKVLKFQVNWPKLFSSEWIHFQFCDFCGFKKGRTTNFFAPLFCCFFGSGMNKNQDSGSTSRIRNTVKNYTFLFIWI